MTWFQSTLPSCSRTSPMTWCLVKRLKSNTFMTAVDFRREDLGNWGNITAVTRRKTPAVWGFKANKQFEDKFFNIKTKSLIRINNILCWTDSYDLINVYRSVYRLLILFETENFKLISRIFKKTSDNKSRSTESHRWCWLFMLTCVWMYLSRIKSLYLKGELLIEDRAQCVFEHLGLIRFGLFRENVEFDVWIWAPSQVHGLQAVGLFDSYCEL